MTTRLRYRDDLQGLRAIAVSMVVAYHLFVPGFASGFVGVDIFFVLSGYLITRLLMAEAETVGNISLLKFYARRLKRLLPALIVMVAVSAIAAYHLLPPVTWVEQTKSAPFALTWTSNLFFGAREVGYFDELAAHDLYLHTWSLGVEEQFYLVWPLLLLLLFFFRRDERNSVAFQRRFGLIAVGLLLGGLLLSDWLVAHHPQHGFYQMPSRIWQFALGALVHIVIVGSRVQNPGPADCGNKNEPCPETVPQNAHAINDVGNKGALYRSYPVFVQWVGFGLILASATGWLADTPYPGYAAVPPSLGAALMILGGHKRQGLLVSWLGHGVMRWLGDRSYSLYLWHWPVLILWNGRIADDASYWNSIGIVTLSLLLADLSYRFVERPFWKGRASHVRERLALLTSVLLIVVVGSGFSAFYFDLKQQAGLSNLQHALAQDVPPIYRMPCDSWYHSDALQPCVFGEPAARRTVVMVGDSIGAQWFSVLPVAFDPSEWRIVVHTKSSCPLVDEPFFYSRIGARYIVCENWRKALLEELQRVEPDVVIIGSASTYGYEAEAWIEGTRRFVAALDAVTDKILLVPGTPSLGFDGPSCIAQHLAPDGSMPIDACIANGRMEQPEEVADLLTEGIDSVSSASLLDLNDVVCPGGKCSAIASDGTAVFRDSQHLTDTFVRARATEVAERIDTLLWR